MTAGAAEAATDETAGGTNWIECQDDGGNTYYYNNVTGEKRSEIIPAV
jgi:hypothetical protein